MANCENCGYDEWRKRGMEERRVELKWICQHCLRGLPSTAVVRADPLKYLPYAGIVVAVNVVWAIVFILAHYHV